MLDLFAQIVPLIFEIIARKGSVTMFDLEKYLIIQRGERISWPMNEGDKIIKGSVAEKCLQTGEKVVIKFGADFLGFPYTAIGYPIRIQGEIAGGISVGIPTEMIEISNELQSHSTELTNSLTEISGAVNHMIDEIQELENSGMTIWNSAVKIQEKSRETEEVVRYINTMASSTKLLGINATIEAARVGELGRGFSVVANEIQKMAVSSTSSAGKIRETINGIKSDILGITGQVESFKQDTQEVLAAIEEIGVSLESIHEQAERLQKLAEKL